MDFYTDVLPLLTEMSEDESADGFAVLRFLREAGCSKVKSERYLDMLLHEGLVEAQVEKNGAGDYALVYGARITASGLKQLDLWPADNERALHLVTKVAETLGVLAADAEPEEASRLRKAGQTLGEFGVAVAAGVVAGQIG